MNVLKTLKLERNQIKQAAALIKQGKIVAFPTDTVYGIGADARNSAAVEKIFKAKKRPADRPLSVLIGTVEDIYKYTADVPAGALKLAEKYWPGPLTIILKHNQTFAEAVTAGKDTVGLRIPDNPVALALLQETESPLSTPSANLSGRPSPTKASHVLEDLDGAIAAVIDGGDTSTGIESTVIDLSDSKKPLILRPGTISKEEIEETLNQEVNLLSQAKDNSNTSKAEKHYQPKVPVYMVKSSWSHAIAQMKENDEKVALLANQTVIEQYTGEVETVFALGEQADAVQASRHLFEGLRTLENSGATVILAEIIDQGPLSSIYMNRLENAANYKLI